MSIPQTSGFLTLSATLYPLFYNTPPPPSFCYLPSSRKMASFAESSTKSVYDLKAALELACEEISGYTSSPISKCGKLLCQVDSSISEYHNGSIVSLVEIDSQDKSNNHSHYILALTETVFFPKGGGQPWDTGNLVINNEPNTSDNAIKPQLELTVTSCQNIKGFAIIFATSPTPLPRKCYSTAKVLQSINKGRRLDHMCQHTGQHLLSAVASRDFQMDTFTWSMGEGLDSVSSYVDFTLEGNKKWGKKNVSMIMVKELEVKCNEFIVKGVGISPKWYNPEDPVYLSTVRSRLLPKDLPIKGEEEGDGTSSAVEFSEKSKTLRVVTIEGLDSNTCCGTHLSSTIPLQNMTLFNISNPKPTILRIYFACGERQRRLTKMHLDVSNSITDKLKAGVENHATKIEELINLKKSQEKKEKKMWETISNLKVNDFVARTKAPDDKVRVISGTPGLTGNFYFIIDNIGEDSGKNFAGNIYDGLCKSFNIEKGGNIVCLFIESDEEKEKLNQDLPFYLFGCKELLSKIAMKELLPLLSGGAKGGGGKGDKYQGKGGKGTEFGQAVRDVISRVEEEVASGSFLSN